MDRTAFRFPFAASLLTSLATIVALPGCGPADDPTSDATLVIRGAASADDAPGYSSQGIPPDALVGNPAEITLKLDGLLVGSNADCSNLVSVQDYGTTPAVVDLVKHPVLFEASPPEGSYGCVAFRMSDQVRVRPAGTFGACSADVDYTADIFRAGAVGYRDETGAYRNGQGTDTLPVEERILLVMTTNRTAAENLGFSPHQIIDLGAPLVVPGSSTFVWQGDGTVVSWHDQCGVFPGEPTFF